MLVQSFLNAHKPLAISLTLSVNDSSFSGTSRMRMARKIFSLVYESWTPVAACRFVQDSWTILLQGSVYLCIVYFSRPAPYISALNDKFSFIYAKSSTHLGKSQKFSYFFKSFYLLHQHVFVFADSKTLLLISSKFFVFLIKF